MSCLVKLSILGVRSFSPEDAETIKFMNPLTLILGQNGTGKTTIIECLKYITTGDFPAGSKNSYFVHDPKVSNRSDVKAQVKLQFKDSRGGQVTVARSMTNTQKAKTLQFQTLDNVIQRDNDKGEQVSISSKCADINAEMINLLGVSKAVLTNVIFCHQEESNWPLSEGKALKQKFDEIFAATRYIKALDLILKTRKDLNIDLKLMDTDVKYLKQFKQQASEKRDELSKMENRLAASKNETDQISIKLKPINLKLDELRVKEMKLFEVQKELETRSVRLKEMNNFAKSLINGIKEHFQGSDDELKQAIREFEDNVLNQKSVLMRRQRDFENVKNKIRNLQETKTRSLMKLGKLQTEHNQHLDRIKSRDKKIVELCRSGDVKGHSLSLESLDSENLSEAFEIIEQLIDTLSVEIMEIKSNFEDEENNLQTKIDDLRVNKTKLEQEERLKRDQLKKNNEEILKIKINLDRVDTSAANLDHLESELHRAERELVEIEQSVNIASIQSEISDHRIAEKEKEARLNQLSLELNAVSQQTEIRTKLDHQKKEKIGRETSIKKIFSKHEDTLKALLGTVPSENLRSHISDYLSDKAIEIRKLRKGLSENKMNLSRLEANRSSTMEQIRKLEDDIRTSKEKVFVAFGSSENSDACIENLGGNIKKLQNKKANLSASTVVFNKFIDKLKKENACCPLCHREFDDENDIPELIIELQGKLKDVPNLIANVESGLCSEEKNYKNMLQLKPIKDDIDKKMSTEIPKLKKQAQFLEDEICKLRATVIKEENVLQSHDKDEASANEIRSDMGSLDQYQSELTKISKNVEFLESKIVGYDSTRTLQQVNQDRNDVESYLSREKGEIDRKKERISNYQNQLCDARIKVTDLKTEKQQVSEDLQQKNILEENKAKLRASSNELDAAIKDAGLKIKPIEWELNEKKQTKDMKTKEKETTIKTHSEQLDIWKNKQKDIQRLHKDIERYIDGGKEASLEEEQRHVDDIEVRIQSLNDKSTELTTDTERINKELGNTEVKQRELEDNRKLREKKKEIDELQVGINECQEKLGDIDVRNLESEKKKLTRESNELLDVRQRAKGRQAELVESIQKLTNELEKKEFKNADVNYKNKVIELKTTEIAVEDLEKYYKALDKAVNRFHCQRMEDVNKITRELWQQTYKGNDIDYIQIRTEEESGMSATSKRRTYNYSVVMVKGNTELEMRGRCSAGQKVLASLIIRLALAETFCLNCGMLALDEPTTNLDRENIESLANALISIVEMHRGQKNFQLVIITHDEDFIDVLSRGESAEHFYKVDKNDLGYSRIKKRQIGVVL